MTFRNSRVLGRPTTGRFHLETGSGAGQHPSHKVGGEHRAPGPGPRGTIHLPAPGAWQSPPTPAPAQPQELKPGCCWRLGDRSKTRPDEAKKPLPRGAKDPAHSPMGVPQPQNVTPKVKLPPFNPGGARDSALPDPAPLHREAARPVTTAHTPGSALPPRAPRAPQANSLPRGMRAGTAGPTPGQLLHPAQAWSPAVAWEPPSRTDRCLPSRVVRAPCQLGDRPASSPRELLPLKHLPGCSWGTLRMPGSRSVEPQGRQGSPGSEAVPETGRAQARLKTVHRTGFRDPEQAANVPHRPGSALLSRDPRPVGQQTQDPTLACQCKQS